MPTVEADPLLNASRSRVLTERSDGSQIVDEASNQNGSGQSYAENNCSAEHRYRSGLNQCSRDDGERNQDYCCQLCSGSSSLQSLTILSAPIAAVWARNLTGEMGSFQIVGGRLMFHVIRVIRTTGERFRI